MAKTKRQADGQKGGKGLAKASGNTHIVRAGGKRAPKASGDAPMVLAPTTPKQVVDALVDQVNVLWGEIEGRLQAIGKVILEKVFAGDAKAALDPRRKDNPVYREFVSRIGHKPLVPNARALSIAVRLAAYDHVVGGGFWRALEGGRREALLPLREAPLIREGAKRAIEFDLSRADLGKWVKNKLIEVKKPPAKRPGRVTVRTFARPMEALSARLSEPGAVERLAQLVEALPPSERAAFARQVHALAKQFALLTRMFPER